MNTKLQATLFAFLFSVQILFSQTPTITNLSPTSGGAGATVTITGTNFTGATAVKIGGTNATSFTVDSATSITAVVGSGSTGTIAVTTVGGTANSSNTFIFITPPPTSVEDRIEIPKTYSISPSYPNPFQTSTTIKFSLPYESNVKIEIFNSFGQLIQTLLDERMSTQIHEVNWEAGNNPSGLYFYKIIVRDVNNQNNNFLQTRKMMLLK